MSYLGKYVFPFFQIKLNFNIKKCKLLLESIYSQDKMIKINYLPGTVSVLCIQYIRGISLPVGGSPPGEEDLTPHLTLHPSSQFSVVSNMSGVWQILVSVPRQLS